MNTRRKFFRFAAATGAFLALKPITGLSQSRAVVRLTHAEAVETLYYLPLYVAHARGLFQKEGLDVTIFNAQQRTIAVRAVAAGDAFSYSGDPAEPALARLKGVDIKNIGGLIDRVANVIIGKPGISKDPKGWNGKTFVVPKLPHTGVSLLQVLLQDSGYTQADKEGLVWKPRNSSNKSDYINFRPVTPGSELASLIAGQGDMCLVLEPDTSNGIAQGYPLVRSFAEHFGSFFFTSISVMNQTIQKQADDVQRFMNALTKGSLYCLKYPDKAAEVAVERFRGSNANVIADAAKRIIAQGAYGKNLVVGREAYDKNFNLLLSRTNHPAAKYPFEQLMDLRFAEKAAQFTLNDV